MHKYGGAKSSTHSLDNPINNPLPESPVTQPDVTAALSNIDNKMGRLTDLLIRMFERHEPSVQPTEGESPTGNEQHVVKQRNENNSEPFQGERPTGRKRRNATDTESLQGERPKGCHKIPVNSDSENDSEAGSYSSRGKRPRRDQTDDDISIYAGDSANDDADLNELAATS